MTGRTGPCLDSVAIDAEAYTSVAAVALRQLGEEVIGVEAAGEVDAGARRGLSGE
ncbi:hypothetical protein [Streptomyces sp. NPDC060027]|uniref:hypothetical protein n=1 Tax=Streptomyces sp. NPDC060027 TaxID=3347040 RepID=UPI0036B73D63